MEVDKEREVDEKQEELEENEKHDQEETGEEVLTDKEESEEKTEEEERQQDDYYNQLLRLQADFNNYKKRTEREKEGLISFGVEKLASGLFSILDNFERALESQEDKEDGFYQGIEMIYEQLLALLEKNSIKEINGLYEKFDPVYHNAVAVGQSEEYEEGTIINVLQKGYMLNDKVIRPAMVMVAQ